MIPQEATLCKRNGRRLQCTHCGNEDVVLTLRLRHPHGWQVYAQCLRCGARNWEQDQGEPWALIRYMPTEQEEMKRWATQPLR